MLYYGRNPSKTPASLLVVVKHLPKDAEILLECFQGSLVLPFLSIGAKINDERLRMEPATD